MLNRLFLGLMIVAGVNGAYALEVGDSAPCVVLEGVEADGSAVTRCVRVGERAEQRHTVLKFFSAFCSACADFHRRTMDALSGDNMPGGVKFNYVGIDRNKRVLEKYASDHMGDLSALGASVFFDSDRDAKVSYGVRQTPTVYVLNNETNTIVYKHVGYASDADFQQFASFLRNL